MKKIFSFSNKKKTKNFSPDILLTQKESLPKHVAIIMDGNGRWASKRGLPRVSGHKAGMDRVKDITDISIELDIKYLTLYAFSTENWKRPEFEIDFLMKLPEQYLETELKNLIKKNVKVTMIGDANLLPSHTRNAISAAIEDTKDNTGMILNFALNYGSRLEIIDTIKSLYKDIEEGKLKLDDINEETFRQKLMTANYPDPDLLIRTSGEIRLSNFLLWQLAYTEMYFTETLWPDFSGDEYCQALHDYMNRGRRYGNIN